MEPDLNTNKQQKCEEEYVLLDLDEALRESDIRTNDPFILSGLDTPNPVLMIGNSWKLIGEYQETVGTCYLFSETDKRTKALPPENDTPETSVIDETSTIVPKSAAPPMKIEPVTSLQKILKFKRAT